jgi:hypothetical protein
VNAANRCEKAGCTAPGYEVILDQGGALLCPRHAVLLRREPTVRMLFKAAFQERASMDAAIHGGDVAAAGNRAVYVLQMEDGALNAIVAWLAVPDPAPLVRQGDSGCTTFCTHETVGLTRPKRIIGDSTWDTPEWCPFLRDTTVRHHSEALVVLATKGGR